MVFITKKEYRKSWMIDFSKEYKVYLSVHYIDYVNLKEHFTKVTPVNGLEKDQEYDVKLKEEQTIYEEDSPALTGELNEWFN